MNLHDLVGKNLERVKPSVDTVRRLLAGASRRYADSQVEETSAEARFVSAYTAVRMIADLGLHANGFRVRTSVPGHHVIAIRALATTLGIDDRIIVRLDKLRAQRNAAEYSGDIIPESAVAECILQASRLQTAAVEWLRKNAPDLLK
jgi:hypothetical protein